MIRDQLMQHYHGLFKFAVKLTKNTEKAEDLLHDTICRALTYEASYQQGTNLFSWMARIMFNLHVDKRGKKANHDSLFDSERHILTARSEASQEHALELSLMMDKVVKLEAEYRDAILGVMNGDTYLEMAERTGVKEGAIRSRLYRARYQLGLREMPQ